MSAHMCFTIIIAMIASTQIIAVDAADFSTNVSLLYSNTVSAASVKILHIISQVHQPRSQRGQ